MVLAAFDLAGRAAEYGGNLEGSAACGPRRRALRPAPRAKRLRLPRFGPRAGAAGRTFFAMSNRHLLKCLYYINLSSYSRSGSSYFQVKSSYFQVKSSYFYSGSSYFRIKSSYFYSESSYF